MFVAVNFQAVRSRKLAAVRREVVPGAAGSSWKPASNNVWEFLRGQPGLRTDGHNIFVFTIPNTRCTAVCDFGVEVTRPFEAADDVFSTERRLATPLSPSIVDRTAGRTMRTAR